MWVRSTLITFNRFWKITTPSPQIEKARDTLGSHWFGTTDVDKWFFVFGTEEQVMDLHSGFKTNAELDTSFYTPYAYIIDREMNLRGRNDDEDLEDGLLYGYDAETVAPIHKKMVDDVKVVLAEYRLALKKNKREI